MDFEYVTSTLLGAHHLLLISVSEAHEELQSKPETDPYHINYIYRLSRHISELSNDFILLELNGPAPGASIILRSMLESLFSIGATVAHDAFAAEKVLGELDKYLAVNETSLSVDERNEFGEIINSHYGVRRNGVRYPVYQIARKANLTDLYDSFYRHLCNHSHGNLFAVISSERDLETEFHVRLTQFSMICAATSGYLAETAHLGHERVDRASEIIDTLYCTSFTDFLKQISPVSLRKHMKQFASANP